MPSSFGVRVSESRGLVFRVRSAVAELIGRTPGFRSVLGPLQKLTHLDPSVRHTLEREALGRRHEREKLDTAREKRTLSRVESREKASLEKTIKKAARQVREMDNKLRPEFYEAARDRVARDNTDMGEGDLRENFNDAAEFIEGADRAGEDDDDRAPSWKERAENIQRGHKPRRGKGYGYRRDDK